MPEQNQTQNSPPPANETPDQKAVREQREQQERESATREKPTKE
jgi:hypothetical protein